MDTRCDYYFSHSLVAAPRLQSARLLLCQVLQLFCVDQPSAEEAAAQIEAESMRHWLGCFLSGEVADDADACQRFQSHPDAASGVCSVQEIELFRVPDSSGSSAPEDACSRCLDWEQDDAEDASECDGEATAAVDTRCFLWFVYQSSELSCKVGLLYCADSGSWVQFVTHALTDQLLDTRSGQFDRRCPHLAWRLHRILADLKQSLVAASLAARCVRCH